MDVRIAGRASAKRNFIEICIRWCLTDLKLLNKKIILEVITRSKMIEEVGSQGMAVRLDNTIILAIDTGISYSQIMRTVAHEMIHVKQLISGTLRYNGNKTVWRGREMSDDLPYLERPWELEAFAKQEILARRMNEDLERLYNVHCL